MGSQRNVRRWPRSWSRGPGRRTSGVGVIPDASVTGPHRRPCRVGPANFTPSLSQIPDVNLSIHTARVIARRLPPSADYLLLSGLGSLDQRLDGSARVS